MDSPILSLSIIKELNVPNNGFGVIAFWHTFMLPCWKIFERKNAFAVVSLSKDGELLSTLLKKMKFQLLDTLQKNLKKNHEKSQIQNLI